MNTSILLDYEKNKYLQKVYNNCVESHILNFGLLGDLVLPVIAGQIDENQPGYYKDSGTLIKPTFKYGKLVFSTALVDMVESDTIGQDKLKRAVICVKRRKIK